MTRVIVDASLKSKLHNLTEVLELCDESGHILGRFTPEVDSTACERYEPQLSEEELERRRLEPDYSTAEVLAFLEKL